MNQKNESLMEMSYSTNDDLYPTQVVFANRWKVLLICSEDGKMFLDVEDLLTKSVVGLSQFALSKTDRLFQNKNKDHFVGI